MRTIAALISGLILVAACSGPETDSPEAINQFDHVMVGIADLDSGIAALEEMTGVAAVHGGVHPGRDTRNALLSLGDGNYFELIAPQADLETITDPIAAATLALQTPTPIHWAISTTNIEATRSTVEELGWGTTAIDARSRETPDGTLLSWRMFFITEDADAASIPFFIEWGEDSVHPSQTSPEGCEISDFVIYRPDVDRMSRLLESLQVDVEVRQSGQDSIALILDCGGDAVTL